MARRKKTVAIRVCLKREDFRGILENKGRVWEGGEEEEDPLAADVVGFLVFIGVSALI